MDDKTTEKLTAETVRFTDAVIRIADEGGYDRDSFLKAVAGMITFMADVVTVENYKAGDKKEETT